MDEVQMKMDENRKEMENNMLELQNSISSMIFKTLNEKLPKRDMEIQGNRENNDNNGVETQLHMGIILSQLRRKNTKFQNHSLLQY
jgi:hypothetical protein